MKGHPPNDRILVCGGRDYTDRDRLFTELDAIAAKHEKLTVIHGHARGADSLADEWARSRRHAIHGFRANWEKDGRAAGPIRNQRMLDQGKRNYVAVSP